MPGYQAQDDSGRGGHPGDDAEYGRPDVAFRLVAGAQGIVEGLQEGGEHGAAEQADGNGNGEIFREVRRVLDARRRGGIDDGDGAGPAVRARPDLLHPLEQAGIGRAVGIDLALTGLVRGAALLQRPNLGLDLIDARGEFGLLARLRLVVGPGGVADASRFPFDLAFEFGDLRLELHHLRVAGLEHLQLLLVLSAEFGLLLLEGLDDRAVQGRRGPPGSIPDHLLVLRLRGDARGLGGGLFPAQVLEPIHQDLDLAVQVDDALPRGVCGQAPFGGVQLGPNLPALLAERGPRARGRPDRRARAWR